MSRCNLSTWEVETGESGVQNHPQLYSEFGASLGQMKIFQNTKKKEGKRGSRRLLFCATECSCDDGESEGNDGLHRVRPWSCQACKASADGAKKGLNSPLSTLTFLPGPSSLVQKLEMDQRSMASLKRGAEPKAILSKQKAEWWKHNAEAIKLAEQKPREEGRRRARR